MRLHRTADARFFVNRVLGLKLALSVACRKIEATFAGGVVFHEVHHL